MMPENSRFWKGSFVTEGREKVFGSWVWHKLHGSFFLSPGTHQYASGIIGLMPLLVLLHACLAGRQAELGFARGHIGINNVQPLTLLVNDLFLFCAFIARTVQEKYLHPNVCPCICLPFLTVIGPLGTNARTHARWNISCMQALRQELAEPGNRSKWALSKEEEEKSTNETNESTG